MRHRSRTRRRFATTAIAVLAGAALIAPLPASAATSPSNWWWDTYGIPAIHAEGWTGAGVKIAILDDQINPDLPAFAGRDLTVADGAICAEHTTAVTADTTEGAVHGTTLTASLIGTGQGGGAISGIVPDAEVVFYGLGRPVEGPCTVEGDMETGLSPQGVALQRAIDDGAQIFTSSVDSPGFGEADAAIMAEALARGMVLVAATENPTADLIDSNLDHANGVVAVSAIDSTGELQTDDAGAPWIRDVTTVVGAGVGLPTLGRAGGAWDDSSTTNGSSFTAPLVAGMLAAAAQKFPDATGNQLIQALIHTTNGAIHDEAVPDVGTGYGYGAAWPATLLQSDPSSYPDENPLMDRELGIPSSELVASARADLDADEPAATGDPGAPTDDAPADLLAPVLVAVLVVLGVVVVAAVITIVIVISRKNRNRRGGTP